MPLPRLESELADDLRLEFGSRAVEFLESAQRVLDRAEHDWPRVGETVAYLCREALESITLAGGSGSTGPWRELSREIVDAANRYANAAQTQDEDAERLLGELLHSIEEIGRFHREGESRHQRRLIAVIVARAGVPPSEGSGVISAFQGLFDRLNDALHGECSVSKAQEMFGECVALIRRLFMPAEMRSAELRRLAAIGSPSAADVRELLNLIGTSVHLKQFVQTMANPQWLAQIDSAGVFDQEHLDVWWAVASAAGRLGTSHAEAISELLESLWQRNTDNPERVQCVADAARRMGRPGAGLLLQMLRRHPDNGGVVFEAMQVATDLDAADAIVTDYVDLLFNETCWPFLIVPERLADHLVAGVNEHNALARLNMLCFKLKAVDVYDYTLMRLCGETRGSVAEADELAHKDRSPVLVSCLVSVVRASWGRASVRKILETLSVLPDRLRERYRAWALAEAPEADVELLIAEVEQAIGSRSPTGDDVKLLERVERTDASDEAAARWGRALGEPPTVEQIGRSLASDNVPRELVQCAKWARLLSSGVNRAWDTAVQLLDARIVIPDRRHLEHRPRVEATTVTNPLSSEELSALTPVQAAERVAAWRRSPADWDHAPRHLAGALREAVQQNVDEWLTDPVGIAAKLYHPTYITAYLQGVKEALPEGNIPVEPLLDVIALVHTTPWDVVPLADNAMDYEADWLVARRASRELIVAMAAADVQFGDRSDQAWRHLYDAATDTSSESWAAADPLTRAINRDCTRAFDAAVPFIASELRAGLPVRAEFIELLKFALTRVDNDGEEYRAIVARRLVWLRHALPDWTDSNIDLLFGADAPPGLAQLTVDLAIHWGAPNQWLFETAPEMVRHSVLRDTERSMDHLMIALLRDWPGYRLDDIIGFITRHHRDHPGLASKAGTRISHIVDHENTEQQHIDTAVQLWTTLLDSTAVTDLSGFCWMHRATALDDETWAQLTLRTIETVSSAGRWWHGVIERAMQTPASRSKLAVLNAIVRGPLEQWERYHIGEHIGEVLSDSAALRQTAEYRRLVTALREHDMIRDEPEEDS